MILDRVLARKDRAFTKPILAVSKVKLYVFKTQWAESNVEGPMFLYKRSESPQYRMIIFNTARLKDFSVDFDMNLRYAMDNQFLMIKRDFVYGVWFYNEDEFVKMEHAMHEINALPGTIVT